MGRSGERDGDGLGGTPLPGTPFPSGVLWERGGRAPEGAVEGRELSLCTIPALSDDILADSRCSIVLWLESPWILPCINRDWLFPPRGLPETESGASYRRP